MKGAGEGETVGRGDTGKGRQGERDPRGRGDLGKLRNGKERNGES